jgi:hypothetical protein
MQTNTKICCTPDTSHIASIPSIEQMEEKTRFGL